MINYDITEGALRTLITTQSKKWLRRAAERSVIFDQIGRYKETTSIWSEIKVVYMRLQGQSKCAYCERKLESEQYGKGEQAVEHFRPKGKVAEWRVSAALKREGIAFAVVPKNRGYYRLAYDIFNYCAACEPCNSALKRNLFPIAGKYDFGTNRTEVLREERPYLIYPIGRIDELPEELIEFRGTSPRPISLNGFNRKRALVTIEFFGLDDALGRKNLFLDRAKMLLGLYPQLEKARTGVTREERGRARRLISAYQRKTACHSNCAAR